MWYFLPQHQRTHFVRVAVSPGLQLSLRPLAAEPQAGQGLAPLSRRGQQMSMLGHHQDVRVLALLQLASVAV